MVGLFDTIYTFVGDDGVNVNIDSKGLYEWVTANKPEIFLVPLNYAMADKFINENTVSRARVFELMLRTDLTPIIFVKDGTYSKSNGHPNVMLVDGHHRYMLACLQAKEFIEAYMLEPEQWHPFKLDGIPSLTKEQLIAVPITKRNY